MFRELFTAFGSGKTLERAFSQLDEMLDHALWMFLRANEVLHRRVGASEVRESIYSRDKLINGLLRLIRGQIVRHLTISPGAEVAASLALMSVAKDAERIGDYCKNVFEVGQFYTEDFHVAKYHEPLAGVCTRVEGLFDTVRRAFRESDEQGAREAIRTAEAIGGECDRVVAQLLVDKTSIETHEAVAYSLLARHYKRVSSHLANIATAVLGKVEELDFRP